MKRKTILLIIGVLLLLILSIWAAHYVSFRKEPDIKTEYYKQALDNLITNYIKKNNFNQSVTEWYALENHRDEALR